MRIYRTRIKAEFLSHILFCVLAIASLSVFAMQANAESDPDMLAAQAVDLYKQKKYQPAFEKFVIAAKARPASMSLQYYLGLCAIQVRQSSVAQDAFSRIVVTVPSSEWVHKNAAMLLKKYFNLQPFCCIRDNVTPPGTMRWDTTTSMPLKVYVSDGKQLPGNMGEQSLSPAQMHQIAAWARNPGMMQRLDRAKEYTTQYRTCVIDGLRKWDRAARGSGLSFEVTNDCSEADVLVFWSSTIFDKKAGLTFYPLYPQNKREPIVILLELNNKANASTDPSHSLRVVSAHEFGHAFGLEHSPRPNEIMYETADEGRVEGETEREISENERATLRGLYAVPPVMLLLSTKPRVQRTK